VRLGAFRLMFLATMLRQLKRFTLLLRRFLRAREFGVHFVGTTKFLLPRSVRWRDRSLLISAPEETGLAWDFINLALDDEYGLREFHGKPKTVIDVGANVGLFSILAAHYFTNAMIHAYEPNPRVIPYAAKNLQPVGVTLFNEGIGRVFGFATIQDRGESRYAHTLLTESASGNVPIIPLTEAVERMGCEVDLLKLDCEGAEWEIFQEPRAFEQIRNIRMEYHLIQGHSVRELKRIVTDLDFRIDRWIPNQGFGIVWLSRNLKFRLGGLL
jgi:FkbM family methyltransferase